MNPLITVNSAGVPVTTSQIVAEKFDKQHKDVLKAISNVDCSDGFRERNFALSYYTNDLSSAGKRKYKMYEMKRDGFVFLVMGFTGKKAAEWKEKFIEAFNEMERIIWSEGYVKGKTDFHDAVKDANGAYTFEEAGQILELGRNTLCELLRENKIIMNSFKNWNLPYQKYLNQGYFYIEPKVVESEEKDWVDTQVLITPNGITWLSKLISKKHLNPKIVYTNEKDYCNAIDNVLMDFFKDEIEANKKKAKQAKARGKTVTCCKTEWLLSGGYCGKCGRSLLEIKRRENGGKLHKDLPPNKLDEVYAQAMVMKKKFDDIQKDINELRQKFGD